MTFEFEGTIWYWRGPSPHHFVTVPEEYCEEIRAISGLVTYGWGMIPVEVRLGDSTWRTSLWPKDGRYIVPLRLNVRQREGVGEGDNVTIQLTIG